MKPENDFLSVLTNQEREFIATLNSPFRIQNFLDSIPYSCEPVYRCPLQVLRDSQAHCFDGALFAAAALRLIGYPPLILDMFPDGRDDEHLLALYKMDGHWGAVAKSNTVGLRFREPIFRTLREVVLSYFEFYYNTEGEKTLRDYSVPLNLSAFDVLHWMTRHDGLEQIARRTDELRRFPVLTPNMIANLSPVDERLFTAGLSGANEAGLFRP